MRYTKDDVEFHSDYLREAHPAVNVKVHRFAEQGIDAARREDRSLDPRFEDWYRERLEDADFAESYFAFACEAAWEMLQQDAEHLFGEGIEVDQEGRSGGWAAVRGLPDFETWDAIMLGKWRTFENWARSAAANIPEDMAILAAINSFEVWLKDQPSLVTIGLVNEGVGTGDVRRPTGGRGHVHR